MTHSAERDKDEHNRPDTTLDTLDGVFLASEDASPPRARRETAR
jgi:hypothetical protein